MLTEDIFGLTAVYGPIILNIVVHGKTATMFKVKLRSLHELQSLHSKEVKSPEPNGQMLNSTMIPMKSMGLCLTPAIYLPQDAFRSSVFGSGILHYQ